MWPAIFPWRPIQMAFGATATKPPWGGTFSLYGSSATCCGGLEYWTTSGAPVDSYNSTGGTLNPAGTNPLPAYTAAFHPGPGGEYSLYRFTAPASDTYNLGVTFTGFDNVGGTTTDVHVLFGGNTSLFSGNINGYGSTASYVTSLLLAANDIIDFAVGYGGNGYFYDSTSIAATLIPQGVGGGGNSVPEPASLALLTIGLGCLAARRRKIA